MARPDSLKQTLPGLTRFVSHFWPYMRKYKGLMAGSMMALLAQVVLRILEPWPLKFIFDRVLVPQQAPEIVAPNALDPLTVLTLSAVALVVITGLRALVSYLSTVGFAIIGNRVLTEVREDLYRHLQSLSLSFHNRSRGGDLTVRVISDVGMLKEVTVTALMPMVGNILVLVTMAGVMFWLNWRLALVSIAIMPLFWLRSVNLSRKIQTVSRRQRKLEGDAASTAAESIGAIKVIQALSLQNKYADVFASDNNKSLNEGVQAKRLEASLERSVDVLIAIATALVLWYGARLVLANQLTPGDLLVFITYLKTAFKPVRDFAKYTGRIAKASAAGDRVLDIFNEEPEVRDLPGAIEAPPLRGAVQFRDVTFAYEQGQSVLENIDFDVKPGQQVALVGASGHGKSTLASLLLRLYDPNWGCVIIDGRDIRRYTVESLRNQISVVLQDNILFAASLRENIAYGVPEATPEAIEDAARLANAHDFIQKLPEGYDTLVGERGVTLSGGQRQRIAIARAAIRESPILILDEPTTGLDEENEQAVNEALTRLARGRTTFVIAHDLTFATRADLILYIEGGRLVESGSHAELLEAAGRYATLYRLQAKTHQSAFEVHDGEIHALVS
ncbi:ABC transporter ATP-binding protein [soil metagenome]